MATPDLLPGRLHALRPSAWIYRIRARLFLSLALLATLLLLSLAIGIERAARRELEGELTRRLHSVGGAAVSMMDPKLIPWLVALSPAQQGFALYQDNRRELVELRDLTGVRRIFLADPAGRSFVDTDPIPIGTRLPQTLSDRPAIRQVLEGEVAAAPLFPDEEGQLRKTGYVPVVQEGRVIAIVGVEADATFLRAVRALRARIVGIGVLGIALAFGLAALVARGLTQPLDRLVDWARRLGAGDLALRAPVGGRDEIAFLGSTLEQMRAQLEARDREQRAMVAGVAHEIRNPLGGIRLHTELLAEDSILGDAQRARLQTILRELDHLGSIVEEFLLYARPARPSPEILPLRLVLAELLEWVRPEAELRGVRVGLMGPPEGSEPGGERDLTVSIDPTHLRQILQNLIRNAIEASPERGEVWIRAHREGRGVRLEVEDQGPGLSPEIRERIFEPFFTTKATGAGLGLAIVQRLTLLNLGRVEARAGASGGACFSLLLPAGG